MSVWAVWACVDVIVCILHVWSSYKATKEASFCSPTKAPDRNVSDILTTLDSTHTHACRTNTLQTHLKAETKDRRACKQQKRDCAHATSFSRKVFNSCKRETALSFITEKPFSFWHRTAASTLALTNRHKQGFRTSDKKSLTFKLQCSSLVTSSTLHIFFNKYLPLQLLSFPDYGYLHSHCWLTHPTKIVGFFSDEHWNDCFYPIPPLLPGI